VKYLVDTSALVRLLRRDASPGWYELRDRGLISICEPVLAETLVTADAKNYSQLEEFLSGSYLLVTIPESVWDMTSAIRRELGPRSAHHGLSVADLVVAATAISLKLTVLHEDADYETVRRFVPQLHERRLSAGPETTAELRT
jgi:predicted nucleic acid-binding protein